MPQPLDPLKGLGTVYTPAHVATSLATWAIRSKHDRVLEPACGGGVLVEAALSRLLALGATEPEVVAVDIVPQQVPGFVQGDFFELLPTLGHYDVVIANPPYARQREQKRSGGSANLWSAFLTAAITQLVPGGRVAFVLPLECLQANYAQPVLELLGKSFASLTFEIQPSSLFREAVRGVVLKAEGYGKQTGYASVVWRERACQVPLGELPSYRHYLFGTELTGMTLGELGSVSLGYVTGANEFFHLRGDKVKKWGIERHYLKKALFKTPTFRPDVFDRNAWERACTERKAGYLLQVTGDEVSPALARYLHHGEALGIPNGYKCAQRSTWYKLPQKEVPSHFVPVLSQETPWFAKNEAEVLVSNNFLTLELPSDPVLTGTLTELSCELEGRITGAGGLKLEPSDARRVYVGEDNVSPTTLAEIRNLRRGT